MGGCCSGQAVLWCVTAFVVLPGIIMKCTCPLSHGVKSWLYHLQQVKCKHHCLQPLLSVHKRACDMDNNVHNWQSDTRPMPVALHWCTKQLAPVNQCSNSGSPALAVCASLSPFVLCCAAGDLSRNRSVGLRLGRGEKLQDIIASMHGAVAEGVLTSKSAHELSMRLRVEVPIIEGIWRVIHSEPGLQLRSRHARRGM